jgi:alpha-beta hydrolase superfamily lysophospholipase
MRLRTVSGLALLLPTALALAQHTIAIPIPGQATAIEADLYGRSTNWVILAHGGRFTKESWKKQAEILVAAGFSALAIRFRGDSPNPDGSPGSSGSAVENAEDVLAALDYLHRNGATNVEAIGASLGGDAVGDANSQLAPGTISRMVILASSGGSTPEKLRGRKLPGIRLHYEKAPGPKRLIVVDGSAHAQFLFETDKGPYVMDQIVRFLSEK